MQNSDNQPAVYQDENQKFTIRKVKSKLPVGEAMTKIYPLHQWPVSGGWGYTDDDLTVIDVDNGCDGIYLEKQFLMYRTYIELIVLRNKDDQFYDISFGNMHQTLLFVDGHNVDFIEYDVTATHASDYFALKKEFEAADGFAIDPDGMMAHLEKAESCRVKFHVCGYFNIDQFFGKYSL